MGYCKKRRIGLSQQVDLALKHLGGGSRILLLLLKNMKTSHKWIPILFILFSSCAPLLYQPSRTSLTDFQKIKVKRPEEIHFSSRDGTPLHGWYFKNRIRKLSKGLLVFFHGNAQNITTHFANLHWILEYGYDYFIFDYQGYGKSRGKPSPKKTVDDGVAAVCWAYQRAPDIPLVIFGQSLGGAIALRTVVEIKDHVPISYVIVDSTFHSYKSVSRSILARSILSWPFQPLAYFLMSDRYAPKKRIAEISPIPLLVLHGDKDKTVPFKLGKKVYQLAKEPKEFIKIQDGDHIDAFWRHQGRYRKELIQRLDKMTTIELPFQRKHDCDPIPTIP